MKGYYGPIYQFLVIYFLALICLISQSSNNNFVILISVSGINKEYLCKNNRFVCKFRFVNSITSVIIIKMKILVLFVIILYTKIEFSFSQQDCWILDFNDPSIMNDVTGCGDSYNLQVQRMYNISHIISNQPIPFYPTSKYYLEAFPGWNCLTSKVFVYPSPETNYVLEMAVNQIIPYYSAFRIYLSSNFHSAVILNDDILGSTNGRFLNLI